MKKKTETTEQIPSATEREIVLPFSVKNRMFFGKCRARMARQIPVDYEGKTYRVMQTFYNRAEDKFYLRLAEAV